MRSPCLERWSPRIRAKTAFALLALLVLVACGQRAPEDQALGGAAAPPPAVPGRCPSPVGLEDPGPTATADSLSALSRIRAAAPDGLFALTDPALWPTIRQGPLTLPLVPASPDVVVAGPARDSAAASDLLNACGRHVLEASWWIALCSDGSTTCVRDRPAAATNLFFVRRHGEAMLWWVR